MLPPEVGETRGLKNSRLPFEIKLVQTTRRTALMFVGWLQVFKFQYLGKNREISNGRTDCNNFHAILKRQFLNPEQEGIQ